jgi:hypothetical protein
MQGELFSDAPPFYRTTAYGHWHHIYDYESKEGRWIWYGPTLTPEQEIMRQRRVLGQKVRYGMISKAQAEREFLALTERS